MKKSVITLLSICLFFLSAHSQENTVMLNNALSFLGTPYVANTLEINDEEELVVNCDEVDCTTLVEYVLAMSLCSEQGNQMSEDEFVNNLQKIRYRNGEIDGYTSRLHYISDWINDNVRKGTIEDVTAANSPYTTTVDISFMSSNPDKYPKLKNSPEDVTKMAEYEKAITGQEIYWVPKDQVKLTGLPWIKNGDIIALTTNIPGLDVSHMGIAIYINGNLHLLHASSKKKEVIVDQMILSRYLERNKNITGIRVVRIKK